MTDKDIQVQVAVPVCVTLTLSREDAESMKLDDLCSVVDAVLEEASDSGSGTSGYTESGREVVVDWRLTPHWDHLPEDECELTMLEDDLFPRRY